jgi:beta-aspartyl-peptidase (threonine type)
VRRQALAVTLLILAVPDTMQLAAQDAAPDGEEAGAARQGTVTEAAVRVVLDAQVEAWNRGDLEGFMAGYWRSPELVFCSGATVTKGWDATLERYRNRYRAEGREMGRLRFDAVEVQALGPDAAFARGAYRLEMSDGQQPHGLFTLVLRRKGGAWRIVHDHTSAAE